MRTTLDIDDDLMRAVKESPRRRGRGWAGFGRSRPGTGW